VVYVYVYSVFRSLNEGALIADFYRQDNRINERTPTLLRLIKRIAGQIEERAKKINKVNPFTRTTTTTVSVAMVCTYTNTPNTRTYIYLCSDVIVLCNVNNIHIATPHNAGISRPFNMRDILIFTRYRHRGYNCAVTTVKNRAADKRYRSTLDAAIPLSVTRLSRCIFYISTYLIVLTSFLYFFI